MMTALTTTDEAKTALVSTEVPGAEAGQNVASERQGEEGHNPLSFSVADKITRLIPYRPGKPVEEVERELGITGIIKLASNENALGPSPRAVASVQQLASKMHIYPDANSYKLRMALAQKLAVEPDALVFGNGSDDVIHLLGVTFLEPGDEVIQGDPSFSRYGDAAILNDSLCHLVPLHSDCTYDIEAMIARINARTRLVFIANPNNPTGTIAPREGLERLLDRLPARALLVLDEAYFEYAKDAPEYPQGLDYVKQGRNVVVLRTFSKAYGLAGFRIGYGVMGPDLANWLNRTREPFNVNLMAQEAAAAALDDAEHIARTLAANEAGKQAFYQAFEAMELPYVLSYGNFVWVDVKKDCCDVFNALLRQGVITRTGDVFGAPTHLRVTTGTEAENQKFLNALRVVLA